MATNEQVLLAILARQSHEGVAKVEKKRRVDHVVQLVKKERSAAKLGCGPRTGPLVEKTLMLLEEGGLGALSKDNEDGTDAFDFHLTPVGVGRFREAYEAHLELPESSTSKIRRHAALSTTRARELAKLGSFIKTRLFDDTVAEAESHIAVEGIPILLASESASGIHPPTVIACAGSTVSSPTSSSYSSTPFTSKSSLGVSPRSVLPRPAAHSYVHTFSTTSQETTGGAISALSDFSDSPYPPKRHLPGCFTGNSNKDRRARGGLLPIMGRTRSKSFLAKSRSWVARESNTKIDIVPGGMASLVTPFDPPVSGAVTDVGDYLSGMSANGALELDLGFFGPTSEEPGTELPSMDSRHSSFASASTTYEANAGGGTDTNVLEELRLLNGKVEQIERMLELGQLADSHSRRAQSKARTPLSAGSFSSKLSPFDVDLEKPEFETRFLRSNFLSRSEYGSDGVPAGAEGTDPLEEPITSLSSLEVSFDDAQLAELRALRSDLRTALWTADACYASGIRPIRVSRDPSPSLETLPSQTSFSSALKARSRRKPYSKPSSPTQRRTSGETLSEVSVGSSNPSENDLTHETSSATTFLERLRDRCVAYFRNLAGRQAQTIPSET